MINVDFIDSSEVTTERIYQWDIGRKIKISNVGSAIAPVVHFCNKKSENALAVESNISGDYYIASIPNTLLQEEYDIIAYIYVGSEEEGKTIKVVHIPVSKRLKPETYVATEDENVIDFLTISTEMKSLLNGLVITEYDSTKSYIKPNIVYYQGSSYICKSESEINGILPTNTNYWGLMCESGANISQITCSNDTLHFKLQDNTIVDVPLNSIEVSVVESVITRDEIDPVIFNITQDENGVLKIGDVVIPQKKLLWSGNQIISTSYKEITLPNSIIDKKIYIEVSSLHINTEGKAVYTKIGGYIFNPISNAFKVNLLDSYGSFSETYNQISSIDGYYGHITLLMKDSDENTLNVIGKCFDIDDGTQLAINEHITAIYEIIE